MISAVCNWAENYTYSIISVLMFKKIMEIRGFGLSFSVLNMTGTVTFNFLSKFYMWEFQLV